MLLVQPYHLKNSASRKQPGHHFEKAGVRTLKATDEDFKTKDLLSMIFTSILLLPGVKNWDPYIPL